jgi:hypothetical protein
MATHEEAVAEWRARMAAKRGQAYAAPAAGPTAATAATGAISRTRTTPAAGDVEQLWLPMSRPAFDPADVARAFAPRDEATLYLVAMPSAGGGPMAVRLVTDRTLDAWRSQVPPPVRVRGFKLDD